MGDYILVLDIGTTNIKSFLINKKGEIHAEARRRPNYILNEPGQVEQDPKEIWQMSKAVLEEVMKTGNVTSENIDSLGITTQRASWCMWNRETGEPYTNINTWQDKRAAKFAEKISNSFGFKMIRGATKLISKFTKNPFFIAASQLRLNADYASARTGFLLSNNAEIKKLVDTQPTKIAWGTIDSWILFNLTEKRLHATDYSNASATGLLDPFKGIWNAVILKTFELPESILPELRETRGDFGETTLFGKSIPIRAIIADQQASLFGQGCIEKGMLKCTNGTGTFVDLNTGNEPFASRRKLYPLIAWRINGETTYMLEGLSHNTGNIIDWIQQELNLFGSPAETERMALSVESTEGIYFLPTFTSGLSFPYWDETARGNLFGISLSTKKAHIVRAILEGICFRIKDIVEGIMLDSEIKVDKIKADGGVSQNKFILQFLADILGIEVHHSEQIETTALGAAFMAGLQTGFWGSFDELKDKMKVDAVYKPQMSEADRKFKYKCWQDIVKRSLNYFNL